MAPGYDEILTPEAMAFVATLNRTFNGRRIALLERRAERQKAFDAGQMPDFLPETAEVRAGDWTIAPIPADLQDRRVEITGPVDRKMVINALNSGAKVFMADFEDANSPTWANLIEGQINLRDAIRRTISFTSPEGKEYRLNEQVAVLFGAPTRLASAREARLAGWRASLRQPLRLRPLLPSTMPPNCWRAAPGHTSTCPRWRATWRRASGTMSSS